MSEKWRESVFRKITNANELKYLDEFLLNKVSPGTPGRGGENSRCPKNSTVGQSPPLADHKQSRPGEAPWWDTCPACVRPGASPGTVGKVFIKENSRWRPCPAEVRLLPSLLGFCPFLFCLECRVAQCGCLAADID